MQNLIFGARDRITNQSSVLIPYKGGKFFVIVGQWKWGEKMNGKWIGGSFWASQNTGLTPDELLRIGKALSDRFR